MVELAYIVEWNWRENIVKPVRCEAQSKAGALIIAMWGHLGLDRDVLDRIDYRRFSAGENRKFTKVSTGGTKAGLWSKDSGRKDIDPETQLINRL